MIYKGERIKLQITKNNEMKNKLFTNFKTLITEIKKELCSFLGIIMPAAAY